MIFEHAQARSPQPSDHAVAPHRALFRLVIAVGLLQPILLGTVGLAQNTPSIDTLLASSYAEHHLEPAPLCDDNTFIRRVTLDLIGRIPTHKEWLAFRREGDRAALVERLLASPEFPRFWSHLWTTAAVGYGNAYGIDRELLRRWFERQIAREVPYDEIVRELLTAEGASGVHGPVNFLVRYPEEPATKVCRLFLGVRLECARCHDHPFDRWTRADFDAMNRFFAGLRIEELGEGNLMVRDGRPEAEESDLPRFLTGARPRTHRWREELAYYLTHCKPFARAYVNRLWYHFFGRGIVEPVDDFSSQNPPSVPLLLEFLRQQAVEQQFQLKPMIRLLVLSEAYQRSSVLNDARDVHHRLFAVHTVKPLTAEQYFESVRTALGQPENETLRRAFLGSMADRNLDDDFIATWEYRETIQDLLHKMAASIDVPKRPPEQWFEILLSREPTPEEGARCRGHTSAEVFFALVMGSEFAFNH